MREIGDRGKAKMKQLAGGASKHVPQVQQQPVPAWRKPAGMVTVQQQPQPQSQSTSTVAGLAEVMALFERMDAKHKEEREQMEARGKLAEQKLEAKLAEQRREMESRLERQRAELTAPAQEAISDQQIAALQARLEGLHAAKLLADEVHGMHT